MPLWWRVVEPVVILSLLFACYVASWGTMWEDEEYGWDED